MAAHDQTAMTAASSQQKRLGSKSEIMKAYQQNPLATLQDLLETFSSQINVALPRHMTPERMIRVVLTTVSQTPKLAQCDPFTICGAVVQSSILGLEPNSLLGEAYLVPFWNNKRKNPLTNANGILECQLQIGYKGHVKLARNSGEIAMVDAQLVCANDTFDFDKGMNPVLIHKWPAVGERGPWVGAWAGFRLKDGTFNFEYMSREEIEEHRDRFTKSRDKEDKIYGPWIDNPEWMWKKTVLIKVLKLAPKSVNLATAIALTETSESGQTQRFSVEVPAALQPAMEDDVGDAHKQIEEPKRRSSQKQESSDATQQQTLV